MLKPNVASFFFTRKLKSHIAVIAFIVVLVLFFTSDFQQLATRERILFEGQLKGPLEAADPSLVEELRNRYMTMPSNEQYNLVGSNNEHLYTDYKNSFSFQFYKRMVAELFESDPPRRNGYFIEAGALDGEYGSNTLHLETSLNWTGLLIEPDAQMFRLMQKKNRKAWGANIGISPFAYPYKGIMRIIAESEKKAVVVSSYHTFDRKSMSSLLQSDVVDDRSFFGYSTYKEVQCFPIATVLLAINQTKVTLFSLDVEDLEWPILRLFPFDLVNVEVWFVEHRRRDSSTSSFLIEYDPEFVKWFEEHSYRLYEFHESNVVDYVFVHKDTPYLQRRPTTQLKTDDQYLNNP